MYSKLDPIPYLEFIENEEGMDNEVLDVEDNVKVRRQVSDCWEYDSDNKIIISDIKANSTNISPNDHIIGAKGLDGNLSQSYYKNFLNQLKDDDQTETQPNEDIVNQLQEIHGSPNPSLDHYIKSGNTLNNKNTSFLKVEEFRKSKKFRENKIPTNTSFSGVDKNQIQNVGLKNYDARK